MIDGKIRKTMAWNRAVKTALGDIIVFLDDDVVLEKDYLSQLLNAYRENTTSRCCGGYGVHEESPQRETKIADAVVTEKNAL